MAAFPRLPKSMLGMAAWIAIFPAAPCLAAAPQGRSFSSWREFIPVAKADPALWRHFRSLKLDTDERVAAFDRFMAGHPPTPEAAEHLDLIIEEQLRPMREKMDSGGVDFGTAMSLKGALKFLPLQEAEVEKIERHVKGYEEKGLRGIQEASGNFDGMALWSALNEGGFGASSKPPALNEPRREGVESAIEFIKAAGLGDELPPEDDGRYLGRQFLLTSPGSSLTRSSMEMFNVFYPKEEGAKLAAYMEVAVIETEFQKGVRHFSYKFSADGKLLAQRIKSLSGEIRIFHPQDITARVAQDAYDRLGKWITAIKAMMKKDAPEEIRHALGAIERFVNAGEALAKEKGADLKAMGAAEYADFVREAFSLYERAQRHLADRIGDNAVEASIAIVREAIQLDLASASSPDIYRKFRQEQAHELGSWFRGKLREASETGSLLRMRQAARLASREAVQRILGPR